MLGSSHLSKVKTKLQGVTVELIPSPCAKIVSDGVTLLGSIPTRTECRTNSQGHTLLTSTEELLVLLNALGSLTRGRTASYDVPIPGLHWAWWDLQPIRNEICVLVQIHQQAGGAEKAPPPRPLLY